MSFYLRKSYLFEKMLYIMPATRSAQTTFRFQPELLARLRQRARMGNKSLNRYVEELLENALGSKEERYAAACRELATLTVPSDLPDSIKRLEQFHVSFNEEELRQDERLAYILGR